MGVKVSIKAKRNSTRRYRSPLISTVLPSTTLRDRTTPVAERSRSAKVHQPNGAEAPNIYVFAQNKRKV
jgi:hypothetical protein